MGFEDIRYQVDRGVAYIVLSRPERNNMLTTATYRELLEAFRAAEADGSVGVVVLTAEGEVFSVGGDFSVHRRRTKSDFRQHLGLLMEIATKIRTLGKPVIAAVNGPCFGGAHQLVLLCDLTIASETARFGQHGVRRGTAPIFWGTQLLPRIVGEKRAREIVFLCREYTADEAHAMGLVNKVVPRDRLMEEVRAWCDELLHMSPRGLRLAKVSLNAASDMLYSAIWHAREFLSDAAGSDELSEGVAALEEGRLPNFDRFRG